MAEPKQESKARAVGTTSNTDPKDINTNITVQEQAIYFEPPVLFVYSKDEEITPDAVLEFINLHEGEKPRYKYLFDQYKGKHDILNQEVKSEYKPDNRHVVNVPKYQVDTFNGYFVGLPPKVTHGHDGIQKEIKRFNRLSHFADTLAEVSKLALIYGRSYIFQYQDEQARTKCTYNSPMDMFVVYDDTVAQEPLFAVRYSSTDDGYKGDLYTVEENYKIEPTKEGIKLVNGETSGHFAELPITEVILNEERMSLFEHILTLNRGYNKALSEKANEIDYFADAYLLVAGAKLNDENIREIKRNRLINFYSSDGEMLKNLEVRFLEKPNADTSQENYLDRIEKLMFQMAMVININDDDFGNASSGEALKYKLLNMSNLAASFERKFQKALDKVYRLFFSTPTNFDRERTPDLPLEDDLRDEWIELTYQFYRNLPKNLSEEAGIAGSLQGVVSKETQLKVLSIVDDVKEEIQKIIDEEKGNSDDYGEGSIGDGEEIDILGEATDTTV